MSISKLISNKLPLALVSPLKKSYHQFRNVHRKLDLTLLSFLARSKIFSSFYYCIFSDQFRREHHAVLNGRLKYHTTSKSELNNIYLLRRNIHRLEKGLIMQPRREIFALDYIKETVDAFLDIRSKADLGDNRQIEWACNVLSEYFRVVSDHPIINTAKKKFSDSSDSIYALPQNSELKPYKRNLDQAPSVEYDQLLKLCHRRRSVRWYQQKPVPRELLDKAVMAATLSPSACNRQPFEFRIFDQPELVQQVASLAGGVKGFVHNFPVIVVVIGQLRAYFNERDRHIIYIDASLASMTFMLALESLGLSSCPINWPDVATPERKMKKLLKLDHDERPVMLISVGFPDPAGMVPYSQKKSLEDIRKYNK